MNEVGIDVSQQKIKQINKELFEKAKKVYIFCNPSVCNSYPEYLQDSDKMVLHIIEDPHEKES
jgi:protein-tyrosine-phosphatase